MASDISSLFPGPEWNTSPRGSHSTHSTGANYLGFSIQDLPSSHTRYPFDSSLEQTLSASANADDARQQDCAHAEDRHHAAPLHLATSTAFMSQAAFTAMNTRTAGPHVTHTISPLQTRFDSSFHSNPSFSADSNIHSAESLTFDPWTDDLEDDKPPPKRRCSSIMTDMEAVASPVASTKSFGGRRKSENVEPGSARAVYLERNRKAASKCRSKQKKQQEELVEMAREFERKNKALKAEVEFLRNDMRELMEIVGKHTGCPDTRLRMYVQREADRLAAGALRSPLVEIFSPTGSASPAKH